MIASRPIDTTTLHSRNPGPDGYSIPHVPLAALRTTQSVLGDSPGFASLSEIFREVILRAPPPGDDTRWHEHPIAGISRRFARPLTFTPYASARPCSARCRFCSETLRDADAQGTLPASLRPGQEYFSHLRAALSALRGVPLSYSLSGLECTDDPDWLLELLSTLRQAPTGPLVEGSVLYTNGAGLAAHSARLLPAFEDFGLSWMEWSRHHDNEARNQSIMRFRPGVEIAGQQVFTAALREAMSSLPVRLVCVVQAGGIANKDDALRYLAWARKLGVSTVIFREFSELPAHYSHNATRRHIDSERITIDRLQEACMADHDFRAQYAPLALTGGYYFWNARWQHREGGEVVFEKSDYRAMLARENSGLIYKLVFYANARLCAGWSPDRHVLWQPATEARA